VTKYPRKQLKRGRISSDSQLQSPWLAYSIASGPTVRKYIMAEGCGRAKPGENKKGAGDKISPRTYFFHLDPTSSVPTTSQ
jgi:hypothetical protein